MPDVATPAAPAAAPSTPAPANGAVAVDAKGAIPETPAAPPQKIKVKYKDDGKDFEEELGEQEIAESRRQARWARRSAEKASKLEREHQEITAALRDPSKFWDIAKRLGHDPDALAEARVVEKYRPETMTPEQRQAWQHQQEAERLKAELEGYKSKEQKASEDRDAQVFFKHIDEQLGEVAKLGLIPKNPRMLHRLADVWEPLHEGGYQPTARELSAEVFNTLKEDFGGLRGDRKGEDLLRLCEELMGADTAKEISKAFVARYKGARPAPQANGSRGESVVPRKDAARRPGESFDDHWNRLHG